MKRADYTYKVATCAGRHVIIIEDLNRGNISVTNDIENVVKEISLVEHLNPANYIIVFKDSMGGWDAWDNKNQQFIPLSETDYRDAIDKYILKQLAAVMA